MVFFRKLYDKYRIRRNPVGFAKSRGVTIGAQCRLIDFKSGTFGSEPYLITLGSSVTIASGVRFVTHDGGVAVFRERASGLNVYAPIKVGNNVFIGINSTILPGVSIGDNCVIGACSLVTKDVPANSVAVGVPAAVLKSLDEYHASISVNAIDVTGLSAAKKREQLTLYAGTYWDSRTRTDR